MFLCREAAGARSGIRTRDPVVTPIGTVVSEEQGRAVINVVDDTVGSKSVRSELVVA